MHHLRPLNVLLSLVIISLAAALATLSSSSCRSASASLPSKSTSSSAPASISINGSKLMTMTSTESISAQTSRASVMSSILKESASAVVSLNRSSSAALHTNGSNLGNQSLAEDYYERGPSVFSASDIIGTGGKYRVWLDIRLASWIQAAYQHPPYPTTDGQIAGELPICGGSTFVSACTEFVAKSAWNDPNLVSEWPRTRTQTPPVPSEQQGTFTRMMRYITTLGIFSSATSIQQSSLIKGIFAGCENIFRVGPGLPLQSYATFLAGLNDVPCTVVPTPATSVCPTMTISYPEATAPPYTTTANVPAGDTRCRAYNPNVEYQAAGFCDTDLELEWGGCPCDASSNLAYLNQLTGPFSSGQNVVDFLGAMEAVKLPAWVWNVTFMGKPYCSAANALVEAQVNSIGTTTAACQALPTQVQFGAVSINDLDEGYCANFNYANDCTGGMQQFCNHGNAPASTCLRAVNPGNRYPQNFKGFEIVPA